MNEKNLHRGVYPILIHPTPSPSPIPPTKYGGVEKPSSRPALARCLAQAWHAWSIVRRPAGCESEESDDLPSVVDGGIIALEVCREVGMVRRG